MVLLMFLNRKEHARKKKYAVIKFWMLREKLSLVLETQSVLYIYLFFIFHFYFLFVIYLFIFCNGKGVTAKNEKKVTAAFDKNKSGEYKKVRTRAADNYTGVS